ncbi:ECF-type sigma factor [Sandarakinorhabdus sp.]|uniref:ECF-type sigma factor n=1 Tax=Sandarakinorhabdus sp. TaxID=1916663 RepID=UPI00286E4FCB|nr:ECF-type sigma factor [Sandarakinorhabdus sp.]
MVVPASEALIAAWRDGDISARDALLVRFAPELKAIASAQLRRERGVSFSSGDLVNDAILKLVQMGRISLNDKAHMMALAARLMRRILIDHARMRSTDKRDHIRVVLNEELDGENGPDLIALETALIRLGAIDEGLMALVEMRYFGGMAMGDIAEVTGLSEATLKRRWRTARAWLADALDAQVAMDRDE